MGHLPVWLQGPSLVHHAPMVFNVFRGPNSSAAACGAPAGFQAQGLVSLCIILLISMAALWGRLLSFGVGEKLFAWGATGKHGVGVQTCSAALACAPPQGCVEHQGVFDTLS